MDSEPGLEPPRTFDARRLARVAALAHLALAGSLSLFWIIAPVRAYAWRAEDQPIQVLTVVLYLAALTLAFMRLRTASHDAWGWTVFILSGLFAGEEMSWIARFRGAWTLKGVRIDSLHDMLELALLPDYLSFTIATVAIACLVFAFIAARWRRMGLVSRATLRSPALPHLALALVFVTLGQLPDLRGVKDPWQKYFFEEIPENMAALSMLFAALASKRGELR